MIRCYYLLLVSVIVLRPYWSTILSSYIYFCCKYCTYIVLSIEVFYVIGTETNQQWLTSVGGYKHRFKDIDDGLPQNSANKIQLQGDGRPVAMIEENIPMAA